jgi:RNA polymerase sigma-32 factor
MEILQIMDKTTALSLYLKELHRYPRLTKQEEIDLAWDYQNTGNEQSLTKLVECNLRLVVWICKRLSSWSNSTVPIEDLLGMGNEFLFLAARSWQPNGSAGFGAYAKLFVDRGVTRDAGKSENLIKIPLNVSEKIRKLKYHERILTQRLGSVPSIQALSVSSGFSENKIRDLKNVILLQPSSLDAMSNMIGDENEDNG